MQKFHTTILWPTLLFGFLSSGCQTASYYGQAIRGQSEILLRQRSVEKLLDEPRTPSRLKHQLQLVMRLRDFAEKELDLPVNGHYLRYADLHRRFVVWDVQAAPEFSLQPKKWWYPFVGRLSYRGYFSEDQAQRCARKLGRKGFDVYLEGIEAYSTLGWFRDPVMNTFVYHSEAELAEIIFHELAHQRVFIAGDTEFNEAFATTVAEEGVRRWLIATQNLTACQEFWVRRQRKNDFVRLVLETRNRLESLYRDNHQPSLVGDAEMRRRKAEIVDGLRKEYEKTKALWDGHNDYDEWMRQPINNAKLNTVATYYQLVPAFQRLLQSHGSEMSSFYRDVRRLPKLSKGDRRRRLEAEKERVPAVN